MAHHSFYKLLARMTSKQLAEADARAKEMMAETPLAELRQSARRGAQSLDGKITYCNTDLDLKSASDLTLLAADFDARGLDVLHVTHGEDGLWYSIVEANEPWTEPEKREPERSIGDMLAVIESLDNVLSLQWSSCTLREFNIGYDCGDEPWAFNQGLSHALLARIVAAGATLRWTLYPDRDRHNDNEA